MARAQRNSGTSKTVKAATKQGQRKKSNKALGSNSSSPKLEKATSGGQDNRDGKNGGSIGHDPPRNNGAMQARREIPPWLLKKPKISARHAHDPPRNNGAMQARREIPPWLLKKPKIPTRHEE